MDSLNRRTSGTIGTLAAFVPVRKHDIESPIGEVHEESIIVEYRVYVGTKGNVRFAMRKTKDGMNYLKIAQLSSDLHDENPLNNYEQTRMNRNCVSRIGKVIFVPSLSMISSLMCSIWTLLLLARG